MKYGINCRVDSNTEIGNTQIQVTIDGMEFILEPSEEGLLSWFTVITSIEQGKYVSQIETSSHSLIAGPLRVEVDEQFYSNLEFLIEYIESVLSFLFGVKKFYREEATHFFEPENAEEQAAIDVISFSVQNHPYPDSRTRLSLAIFKDIIRQKDAFAPTTMVRMFFREGLQEYHVHRYIQAFYNFFFVLEDLYGQGKTNNNQIGEKFKSNQMLRDIVQEALNTIIVGDHLASIQSFLKEENINFGVDGILELIVQVRGNLHHYSGKSTKRKGTPLNQEDFRSIAYLLMMLSQSSIIGTMYK